MTHAAFDDPGYEFTNDWFDQNIVVWDTLVPRFSPKRFLEIGSFEGRSACYLIEKFGKDQAIEIHCVDTWEGGVEHENFAMSEVERRFDKNVQFALGKVGNPGVVVKKHKKLSYLALAELIAVERRPTFDMLYVDGSHQAPDVLTDAVMGFHLVRPGGLMVFDDYIWSMEEMGSQDLLNMPKSAIDAFVNVFTRKAIVVRNAPVYQLYVTKVGG
ncbi:MAG: class I SAM-dependent methyltransferase [Rhodospirillaceae bacterium]|nr:class I SAM-dependent methyltransferase [Rhodospirillaceae bacterium]